jgi:hypothetical protein
VVSKSGVLVRELADEVLILDTVADRIHRLNPSAAVVWRMYEAGAEDLAIADALAATFEVSAEAALTDVRQTIETLRRLDVVNGPEPAVVVTEDVRPDRAD